MTGSAAVQRLIGRVGEVPSVGSEDRRTWLHALTRNQVLDLVRAHGRDDDLTAECWSWGSFGSGTTDGGSVNCDQCGRATTVPLWYAKAKSIVGRCFRCAAINHFAECPWL